MLFWDGSTLMDGKKGTIRPWAGEWLWGFKFQSIVDFWLTIFIVETACYRVTTRVAPTVFLSESGFSGLEDFQDCGLCVVLKKVDNF